MKKQEESLTEPVWNAADLLERVDNDQELLRELFIIFRTDYPRTARSLEAAVRAGDMKNAALLSHSLKGMLANLSGMRAAAAAGELEKIALAGKDQISLRDALEALQREAASLIPELEAYVAEVRR